MCWVHGRGDKSVGRHQAHGMRKNVQRTVRAHGTHRADVNRFFADEYGTLSRRNYTITRLDAILLANFPIFGKPSSNTVWLISTFAVHIE